jgi:ABC-2 type transport system permease protein
MVSPVSPRPARRSLARIYALESLYEILKLSRVPMYVVPTLVFPMMFYVLFGIAFRRPGGTFDIAKYLIASYGAWGVMNAALFSFGVGVAVERGQGWMLFKRATPMPPFAGFAGRLTACVALSAVMVTCLFTLGAVAGGVRMPPAQWLSLAGVLIAGAIPFSAFGLAVGSWAGPNSAPAVINLISLPMSFASGMWLPVQLLPAAIQKIAVFLPAYHYAQLAVGRLGYSGGIGRVGQGEPALRSVTVLAAFTVASLLLARRGFRRDEGKTFG